MSTSWWEMHTPDNAREVQVPPCACGHTHTRTQTVHPARFGEQRESPEERKKKKDWQTSFCCFYVFSATGKRVPAATCLYFSVENNKVYGKKKKQQKNVSFNSSSAAESSWSIRLCLPLVFLSSIYPRKQALANCIHPNVFKMFALKLK